MSHKEFKPFRYVALIRDKAIQHYVCTTCLFAAFMVCVLYANYLTFFLRGGILDDALPAYSIHRQMDEYVKQIPEFRLRNLFMLLFGTPMTRRSTRVLLSLLFKKQRKQKKRFRSGS